MDVFGAKMRGSDTTAFPPFVAGFRQQSGAAPALQ